MDAVDIQNAERLYKFDIHLVNNKCYNDAFNLLSIWYEIAFLT